MADPHTLVARMKSGNEESKNNGSLGLYESSPNPYPQPKRQRSSGTQDEDYVPEEEVYEH
jgi:hypothetical protein